MIGYTPPAVYWPFSPTCPVDPPSRQWLDEQLAWLAVHFADESPAKHELVLPTPDHFPDHYDGTASAANAMFIRVCQRMGVDPDLVQLSVMDINPHLGFVTETGDPAPGAAGLYEAPDDDADNARCTITITADELSHPMALVGTMAHELAHQRLLGGGMIDPDRFDHELLTDLTAVWCGFGIFLANTPRGDWRALYSHWPGTNLLRPEYMNPPMYAYALARIAHLRGEARPAWARHLTREPRQLLNQTLRWLARSPR